MWLLVFGFFGCLHGMYRRGWGRVGGWRVGSVSIYGVVLYLVPEMDVLEEQARTL